MTIIGKDDLTKLIGNQALCADEPPVTTHATFKLALLEELVDKIKKQYPEYIKGEDDVHHVCITFVRENIEKVENMVLYDEKHIDTLKEHPSKEKSYSQVIPILSGCVCKLDPARRPQSFEYLNEGDPKNGAVYVLRPGGEGTGLIPPPPPSGGL